MKKNEEIDIDIIYDLQGASYISPFGNGSVSIVNAIKDILSEKYPNNFKDVQFRIKISIEENDLKLGE